eukprot:14948061-Alexandrium_andersonii.AAC.1
MRPRTGVSQTRALPEPRTVGAPGEVHGMAQAWVGTIRAGATAVGAPGAHRRKPAEAVRIHLPALW